LFAAKVLRGFPFSSKGRLSASGRRGDGGGKRGKRGTLSLSAGKKGVWGENVPGKAALSAAGVTGENSLKIPLLFLLWGEKKKNGEGGGEGGPRPGLVAPVNLLRRAPPLA